VGGQTSATGGTSATGSSFQTFVANSVSNNPTNYFSSSVSGAGSASGTTTAIVCTVSGSCWAFGLPPTIHPNFSAFGCGRFDFE